MGWGGGGGGAGPNRSECTRRPRRQRRPETYNGSGKDEATRTYTNADEKSLYERADEHELLPSGVGSARGRGPYVIGRKRYCP